MAEYNKCADLCSSLIGEPIAKISSSIADEIIRDGKKEVKLPMVVCYRETVETVGDKVRTIGDRFRLVTGQLNRNGVSYDAYGNPTLGSEITGMHAIPMMAPIYGFMPDALSAQTTSLLGDAYDESYVNKAIVSLSKYDIPALKAKSFVVENRRDYRRYKRISKELVGEIKKLFKKTDKEHRKVESVIANVKRDANGREKKAYGAIIKRLSRYLGGCSDRFVASKIAHIISVVEEYMASKRPVVEAQEYANNVLLRDIAPKFDLDNVCSASKLVEIRSCDLYASTKINVGRYFRRDQDALSVEIERYNDYVIEYPRFGSRSR